MKFRDLGEWVGIRGTTLRRRAKLFGHDFKLEDKITAIEAGKLFRQLPIEKVLTITYVDARKPKIEFVGSWNAREWQRMIRKIEHALLLRHRDFSRACRKNERIDEVVKPDLPVSAEPTETAAVNQPDMVSTELVPAETVTSIAALVEADAANLTGVEISPEESSHAGRENIASPGTSAIRSGPEPAGDGACESGTGADPERRELAGVASGPDSGSDAGSAANTE